MIEITQLSSKKMQLACTVPLVDIQWVDYDRGFGLGYMTETDYSPYEITSAIRQSILLMNEEAQKYDLTIDLSTLSVEAVKQALKIVVEANGNNRSWKRRT